MADQKQDGPALAALVRGGDDQTEAVAITDYIFMARDISNAHLVTTDDGDVMVNTGFFDHCERNLGLLAPHRTGPMRYIFLTQSHADHYGCVPAFSDEGTKVVGGPGFNEALHDMMFLQPFFGPRSNKLWGSTLRRGDKPRQPPTVTPDILIDREQTFEVGSRIFTLIHAPEGETEDNVIVWMPKERVAFTGNLVGPVWNSMPFLQTIRGDKPRSVRAYLNSMQKLRALDAELIVTGHGEPIRGAKTIRADIDRMIGAVTWVRDYTLAGMNAGKTVHQLMREVALPDDLTIGEFHGKVSWAVKTIWEEYAGWFHYEDGTTELYGVPRSSIDADLVELAGGADRLAERAQKKVEAGDPLEAIHLTDIVLGAQPDNREALLAKKAALEHLLVQSGQGNLSETMWLRSEIADAQARLGG